MGSFKSAAESTKQRRWEQYVRLILVAVLIVGILELLVASVEYSGVRPYVLLDVVLTPEELQDPDLVEQTQRLLKKTGHSGHLWLFFGLSNVAAGILGLTIFNRISNSS